MDWLPIISTLGFFIIAVISIYLNYKTRTEPYRQTLYSKQLEGYTEIIKAFIDFHIDAESSIPAKGLKGDKMRIKLRLKTKDSRTTFIDKHQKWFVFLPLEVNKSILNYLDIFKEISFYPEHEDKYPEKLREAYTNVLIETSKNIGMARLSKETIDLISW